MTKKEKFLIALLETSTRTDAIKKAGIDRNTAYKYLRDVDFQKELSKKKNEVIESTVRYLQGVLSECAEKLMEIVRDDDTPATIKITAIQCVFSNCRQLTETSDILKKLDSIENRMKEGENN